MMFIKQNISEGFIDVKITKETSLNDFISLIQFLKEEKSLPRAISILVDAPEGFENIHFAHLNIISDSFLELDHFYYKVTLAIIVCKKREHTLSLILQNWLFNQPCQFKTFKCLKDAEMWLGRNQLSNDLTTQKQAG